MMVELASITGWTRWAALLDVACGVSLVALAAVRPPWAKGVRRRPRAAALFGIALAALGIADLVADRRIQAIVGLAFFGCLAWTSLSGSSASHPSSSGPAAWGPDPTGRHELRYWDGALWTMHVSDGGVQGIDHI